MTTASNLFSRSPGPFTPNMALSSSSTGNYDTDPALPASQLDYLNNVTSNVQAQVNSKQDTLVNEVNIHSLNGVDLVTNGDYSSADFDAFPTGVAAAYFPLIDSGLPTPTVAPWPQYGTFPTPSTAKWRVAGYTQLTVNDQPNIFSLLGINTTGFGNQRPTLNWATPNNDSFKTNYGLQAGTMLCPSDGHYVVAFRENLIISHDYGATWNHAADLGIDMVPLLAWLNSLGGTSGTKYLFERDGKFYLYNNTMRYVVSEDRGYTWAPFDIQSYTDASGSNGVKHRELFDPVYVSDSNRPLHLTRMDVAETGEVFCIIPEFNPSKGRWAAWVTQGTPGVLHFSSDGGLTYSGHKELPYWDPVNNEPIGDEYGPMTFFGGYYVFTAHATTAKRTKVFITKDFVTWTFVTSFGSNTDERPPLKFLKSANRLYMIPYTVNYATSFEYIVTDNIINWDGREFLDLTTADVFRRLFLLGDRLCYMFDPDRTSFIVGEVRCWMATDSSGVHFAETERPFYFGGNYPVTGQQYRCDGTCFMPDNNNGVVWVIGWGDSTHAISAATDVLFLQTKPLSYKDPNDGYAHTIPPMWYGSPTNTCKLTYMVKEK